MTDMSMSGEPAYQHNGVPVSRARFYAIACDPRRSVAVEACAGAGKTWMLVSRIVRALLEEGEGACAPHEILAITFTRKAAGEMRDRLDQWLARFAACEAGELVSELEARGMDRPAVEMAAPRLQGLYRRLLESGRPVQFRTFHAWFAGLLRTAPLAVLEGLGLPVNYQLLEDDAPARARCWRPFLAAVAADPAASDDYCALVAAHGRAQAARALGEALARRVEFALADQAAPVEHMVSAFGERFLALAAFARPSDLLCGEAARARWLGWAKALGAQKNVTPQQAARAIENIFGAGALADAEPHWETLRNAFFVRGEDRLNSRLEKYPEAQEAGGELQLLCAAQAQHAAWLHQQRMARLTRILMGCYVQVKHAGGWIDMNDVERAACLLLGESQLWGWVQERLDARIRHVLIDEFQDTNPLQWQALYGWLSGYAGSGGGRRPSVFIVGDPKQSIYRFRRAEPQVFVAAKAYVREGLEGELLYCDHTHRNARAVMSLVNEAMNAAQQAGEFSGFRDHSTESAQAGQTRRLPPIGREATGPDTTEEVGGDEPMSWRDSLTTPRVLPEERQLQKECAQAADWIVSRIAGGLAPGQIMVLARKRSRLVWMEDELRKRRVPVRQPENNDLNDAPEVQDVVALIDALVSTGHDLSLARALKSPLWRIPDSALVQLALRRRARPEASWYELLQDADDALPSAFAGVGAQLRRWREALAALPPHDALSMIYHEARVLERFAAAAPAALRAAVLSNLRGLLAASLDIDGARFATPYLLVRALRVGGVKAPAPAVAEAVQLLTVHGAKGLEAELVLLLDTDAQTQRAQSMGVLVRWPGQAPRPERFVFLASEKKPPSCAVDDLASEQAERRREEINALYVAMTRARTELVLSACTPARPDDRSWWARLQPGCEPIAVAAADAAFAGPDEPAEFSMWGMPQILASTPAGAISVGQAPPMTGGADAHTAAFGQAMHRLLEWAEPGMPLPDAHVQAVAREFGLPPVRAQAAAAMAERIRAGEGGWAWQSDLLDWQGNEVVLLHEGRQLRIDRLVRHRQSGIWWVFDYKSAARPERQDELMAQLECYRQAVRNAYPGATVRAAFLTGQGRMVVLE